MEDHDLPLVPEAIRRIADDPDRKLAWQFFLMFSRFEYALKRQKYIRSDRKDAQAAWKGFAMDHADKFSANQNPRLLQAIAYFQHSPPKKQIHENRVLDWEDAPPFAGGPVLPWLLDQVQTVRNNLFHGGKFPQSAVSDPSRDRELIESALIVLGHTLGLNPDIKHSFFEGIEL